MDYDNEPLDFLFVLVVVGSSIFILLSVLGIVG